MAKRVDHIGILVSNIDEAIKLYQDCFGLEVDKIETLAERGVKAAILSLGQGTNLELLEPLPDSNMAKILEKRGEGLHHITFEVEDVDKELSHLSGRGIDDCGGSCPGRCRCYRVEHPIGSSFRALPIDYRRTEKKR